MVSAVLILAVSAVLTVTSAQNAFDAIQGCKQYMINRQAYNSPHEYYALDQFQDVQEVEVAGLKIRSIKLAVMGSNDGVIRLSPVDQPYQNTLMDEIVLSGWGNTRNAVRQYVRSSPSRYSRSVILVNQLSGGILSPYRPFVFRLSIVNDHLVALSKEGDSLPFLQYTDAGVIPKYIGFSNWNAPVSVFYDCPPPPAPPPPTTQQPPATTTTVTPIPSTTTTQRPVDPTEVPVDPTEAPVDPTEAPVDPTEAPVDPTEVPVDPTDAPENPTEDPVDPTEDPVDPTEDPVDPTEDPVDPTEDPVDPTEDPVDPTEDPVNPTEDPVDPIDPPGSG